MIVWRRLVGMVIWTLLCIVVFGFIALFTQSGEPEDSSGQAIQYWSALALLFLSPIAWLLGCIRILIGSGIR